MARYETAGQCLTQVAAETGLSLPPSTDPYTSQDQAINLLTALLTSAGRELLGMYEWQRMIVSQQFTVLTGDTGFYDLPADYGRHIDQTDWNPSNRLPLGGPLTQQDYTYLLNTNLASSTIYISFLEQQGQFVVLPQPPPVGQVINYRYISRYWAGDGTGPLQKDSPTSVSDVLYFEPILIQKFLRLRWREAKGYDTSSASEQFNNAFMMWTGKDKSAPVLNAARSRSFPYLDDRNVPETNYGLP